MDLFSIATLFQKQKCQVECRSWSWMKQVVVVCVLLQPPQLEEAEIFLMPTEFFPHSKLMKATSYWFHYERKKWISIIIFYLLFSRLWKADNSQWPLWFTIIVLFWVIKFPNQYHLLTWHIFQRIPFRVNIVFPHKQSHFDQQTAPNQMHWLSTCFCVKQSFLTVKI